MTVETGVLERYSARLNRSRQIVEGVEFCAVTITAIKPQQDKPGNAWCAPPGTIRSASETKGAQYQG